MLRVSQFLCMMIAICNVSSNADTISDKPRSGNVESLRVPVPIRMKNEIGLSTGKCYAEKPPAPNAIWVDNSCAEQKVGGACIATCESGYQMTDESNDTFVCVQSEQFVPQTKFECQKQPSENKEWHILGLHIDKVNFKNFHANDVKGWNLQTQLIFGGAFLLLFVCSFYACCRCCRSAWCCGGFRRRQKSSNANEPIITWEEDYEDLYPDMWAPANGDNSINGGRMIFVQ